MLYRNGYEMLADAIIVQAAEDYTKALCQLYECEAAIKELEEFFNGPDYRVYTKLKGTKLMDMLKREAVIHMYDYDSIMKSRAKKERII